MKTVYKEIQDTVLSDVITEMNNLSALDWALVTFQTNIDSSDVITYTVVMSSQQQA